MGNITDYEVVSFLAGDDIKIVVRATDSVAGTYIYHTIRSITGTGDMYADSKNFVCLTDSNIKWGNFVSNTLNMFLAPAVSQGAITIPDGITSIASNFFNGLYYTSLKLPEGITSIGDNAFGPHRGVVNTSGVTWPITDIIIPSTVEHIGRAAFSCLGRLKNITILNKDYIIEDYGNTSSTAIFYIDLNAGSDLDEKGYFKTNLISGNDARRYDWYNKSHRVINQLPEAILRLGHMNEIIEINGYSSGLLPFEHLGNMYWMKECNNGDANQSPLVIRHNGELHFISK